MASDFAAARVLVVEDEALLRMTLEDMLAELGHQVVAGASKLDTAIKLAAETDYDVAILDLNLGGNVSYDVADVAMARGKALVFATGYGQRGLRPAYKDCIILQKPFTQDAVGRAMELACMHPSMPSRPRPAKFAERAG